MEAGEFAMIILAVLIFLLMFIGNLYAARYIVRYTVGKETLRIELFGLFPVRRIKLEDIVEVKIISAWIDTLPFSKEFRLPFLIAERWPSYVFQKKGVFVRKKTGVSRFLILSPENPEEFTNKIF